MDLSSVLGYLEQRQIVSGQTAPAANQRVLTVHSNHASERVALMRCLRQELVVELNCLPQSCLGYSLKELLFTEAFSLLHDASTSGKRLTLKESQALNAEKNEWLSFYQAIETPGAALDRFAPLVTKTRSRLRGNSKTVFGSIFSEIANDLKTRTKKSPPNAKFKEAWNAPLFNLNGENVKKLGDWRSDDTLLRAELQQVLYLLTAMQAYRIQYPNFKQNLDTHLTRASSLLNTSIQKAPRDVQDFLNERATQLLEQCSELATDYAGLVERELRPMHLAISEAHVQKALSPNNADQRERTLAYLRPAVDELASGIIGTKVWFQETQKKFEDTLNELACLTAFSSTRILEGIDPADAYEDFLTRALSEPKELDKVGNFAQIKELLNQERLGLELCSLSAQPTVELLRQRFARSEIVQIREAQYNLIYAQRLSLEQSSCSSNSNCSDDSLLPKPPISEASQSAEPLETTDTESTAQTPANTLAENISHTPLITLPQPFTSIFTTFKLVTNRVNNSFAKQAAVRTNQLLRVLKREVDDRSSASTPNELAEHLSNLLIQLGLINEQAMTTMCLEQADPQTPQQVSILASHSQLRMVQGLRNIPQDLKTLFTSLVQKLDRAEILDRDLYDTTDAKADQSTVEALLRQCEQLRVGRLDDTQAKALTSEVYQFVGKNTELLTDGVAQWLGEARQSTTSIDEWEMILGLAQEDSPVPIPSSLSGAITKVEQMRGRIAKMLPSSKRRKNLFKLNTEQLALLSNADRYLAQASARLSRATASDNLSAFYLTLHRYLYHATHQIAMVATDKVTGGTFLAQTQKKERPHDLWHYVHASQLNKGFTDGEQHFLWVSSKLNNMIRYVGETLHTSGSDLFAKRITQVANTPMRHRFLNDLMQPELNENEWQEVNQKEKNQRKKSQQLYFETLGNIDAVTGVADQFLKKLGV